MNNNNESLFKLVNIKLLNLNNNLLSTITKQLLSLLRYNNNEKNNQPIWFQDVTVN